MITRLNVGGPAIQTVLLSARLDADRFESLLVAGTESAIEGNMIELGRLDAPLTLRRVRALGREISPQDDLRGGIAHPVYARAQAGHRPYASCQGPGTLGRVAARIVGVHLIQTHHGTVFRGYFGSLGSLLFLEVERAVACVTTRLVAITAGQWRDLIALRIGSEAKVRDPGRA